MTKLFKPFAIALMAAVTITSCSDDKDDKDKDTKDPTTKSEITVDGKSYTLQSRGLIENWGDDGGGDPSFEYDGTNLDLYFFTEGVKLAQDEDGYIDSLYGSGLIFYFESFSSNSSRPADGVYNYDPTSPFPVGTFDNGFYGNPTLTVGAAITGGKYTVSSSGSTYTVVFDLTDSGGKKIEGTFKGTFDVAK